jgi:hypothetical protein
MEDWLSVTVIKMGMDVRIIVTVQCPLCDGHIPMQWTGSPGKIHPEFPERGKCTECSLQQPVEIPRKSIIRWWYLAKMELHQVIREDEKRHSISNKSSKCKRGWKKKMKKEQMESIRQRNYDFILSDRQAS